MIKNNSRNRVTNTNKKKENNWKKDVLIKLDYIEKKQEEASLDSIYNFAYTGMSIGFAWLMVIFTPPSYIYIIAILMIISGIIACSIVFYRLKKLRKKIDEILKK